MKGTWSSAVDIRTIWKTFVAFLLYLGFLTMTSYPFYYTSVQWHQGQPVAVNHCYIFLQFIVAIFVSVIIAFMFEETFREKPLSFFKSFPIDVNHIILFRMLKLLAAVYVVYLPVVAITFMKANHTIGEYIKLFPQYQNFPEINLWIPLIQCAIAMAFYIIGTMFLQSLLKSKALTIMLILTYCALEATALYHWFSPYIVFHGSFDTTDYYRFFPPNTILQLLCGAIMLGWLLAGYRNSYRIFKFKSEPE